MQVWKRRVAFLLAVGSGVLGLTLSSAGAQISPPEPPTLPTFTVPDFPTIPSTSPPPTMPPFTFPTTTPPPTMPPPTSSSTTPPPTMPPITSPPSSTPTADDFIEDLISRLQAVADDSPFEEFRDIVEQIIDDFRND